MRGKKPGTLSKFVCKSCGESEFVTGGTTEFMCDRCKPANHHTRTPQYHAHLAVARARRVGSLKNPRDCMCTDCGCQAIEYDHRDYSKPLQVDAVCRRCNLKRGPAIDSPARVVRQAESV